MRLTRKRLEHEESPQRSSAPSKARHALPCAGEVLELCLARHRRGALEAPAPAVSLAVGAHHPCCTDLLACLVCCCPPLRIYDIVHAISVVGRHGGCPVGAELTRQLCRYSNLDVRAVGKPVLPQASYLRTVLLGDGTGNRVVGTYVVRQAIRSSKMTRWTDEANRLLSKDGCARSDTLAGFHVERAGPSRSP